MEEIITLGCPASGKTNYMACSLAYISRYMSDLIRLTGNEMSFSNLVNQVQEDLRDGNWLDKTPVKRDYLFESKIQRSFWFAKKSKINLHDWAGEAFENLADMGKWSMAPADKKRFIEDLSNSKYFLVLLDARCLTNKKLAGKYRKCLAGLQDNIERIRKTKRMYPRFVVALSRSDMLESARPWGIREMAKKVFTGKNKYCTWRTGSLNVDKIREDIRARFNVFFKYLQYNGFKHEIFPVTCIPVREHRICDRKRGTIPSPEWEVKDMERNDQLAPFKWIFGNFFAFFPPKHLKTSA